MREFATIFPTERITVDEAPVVRDADGPWDDDDVIDAVLRLVADHHRAVGAAIGKRSFSPSHAELRQSPLGQDLRLLAAAGYGEVSRDQVLEHSHWPDRRSRRSRHLWRRWADEHRGCRGSAWDCAGGSRRLDHRRR